MCGSFKDQASCCNLVCNLEQSSVRLYHFPESSLPASFLSCYNLTRGPNLFSEHTICYTSKTPVTLSASSLSCKASLSSAFCWYTQEFWAFPEKSFSWDYRILCIPFEWRPPLSRFQRPHGRVLNSVCRTSPEYPSIFQGPPCRISTSDTSGIPDTHVDL